MKSRGRANQSGLCRCEGGDYHRIGVVQWWVFGSVSGLCILCRKKRSARWHSGRKRVGCNVQKVAHLSISISKSSFRCGIVHCCSDARIAPCRRLENIAVNIALGERFCQPWDAFLFCFRTDLDKAPYASIGNWRHPSCDLLRLCEDCIRVPAHKVVDQADFESLLRSKAMTF